MDPSDVQLLSRLQAGDEQAFELLVRTHAGRVRAAVLRLVRNESDADEVTQEAFLAAFKALPGFAGKSQIGTWLHQIAVNAALMRLRSRKRRPEQQDTSDFLPKFGGFGSFVEHQRAWSEPPEDPATRRELCARVRECIDALPEKFRIPLLLRDIEGFSNEDLAVQLGVTVNAAKIRVHRARQALKALLEPQLELLVT